MLEFKLIFRLLKLKFTANIKWSTVEAYLADYDTPREKRKCAEKYWALPMVKQRLQEQEKQLQLLRELANCIRMLRSDDNVGYPEANDDWAKLVEFIPVKEYIAYIYALCCLINLPDHVAKACKDSINDNINITLAFNAACTYFLTLTIPGAIEYGLYDEDVIENCLNILELLRKRDVPNVRAHIIYMFSLTYCDDLALMFRYGRFKNHLKIRNNILKCVLQVMYDNYTHRDKSRHVWSKLYPIKCFMILDEVVSEHNGAICETLNKIMELSFHMHSFPAAIDMDSDHISEWFIRMLRKYPDEISQVLTTFIEAILTNPVPVWNVEDEIVSIRYAAKYDAVLYMQRNISCLPFMRDTIRACDAVNVQIRTLELMDQMLQLETHARDVHSIFTKSREVTIIWEIFLCLNDRTSAVRRKASDSINTNLKNGSAITTRILVECFSFMLYDACDPNPTVQADSDRPDDLHYAFSFEGAEDLQPIVSTIPDVIYNRFIASIYNLDRLAGLILIENMLLLNPRIMYDTDFSRQIVSLAADKNIWNRKALLDSLDTLLGVYPEYSVLIDLYCRIWCLFLIDGDSELQQFALLSFNRNVLLNIQSMQFIHQPTARLPWRILKAVLKLHPRAILQNKLTVLLQKNDIITPELVNNIITYCSEPMATEAWTLLAFISSRITNNLDSLMWTFNDLTSHNMRTIKLLAFELVIYCLKNFSISALKQIFKRLLSALKSGNIWLALVSSAMRLLNHIDGVTYTKENWKMQLYEEVSDAILKGIAKFNKEDTTLASLLGIYTEIIVQSPHQKAIVEIVKFVENYLEANILSKTDKWDDNDERTMNWMIVVGGRFALCDDSLAFKMSKTFSVMLTNYDRPNLINNLLIALADLSQKHPKILEDNFESIVLRYKSKDSMVRMASYRCIKGLVLTGRVKAKRSILILLLSGLVDENYELVREADSFFIRYRDQFDKQIFQKCLKECPFDFNDLPILKGPSRRDDTFNSPLKGPEMTRNRRIIYNHLLAMLDVNTIMYYFRQLKYFTMKTKDATFVLSPGALDVVLDIFFIITRIICSTTKGRNAKNLEHLKHLQRFLPCVPQIVKNLSSIHNPELQNYVDQFCQVVSLRFANITDIAEPADFWKKYKATKSTKGSKKRKSRSAKHASSPYGDLANFCELPLKWQPITDSSEKSAEQREYEALSADLPFARLDL